MSTKKTLAEQTSEFLKRHSNRLNISDASDIPSKEDTSHLRVIKTARDEKSINTAVEEGFFPLVKRVVPSSEIRTKYAVLQNPETGEVKVIGDLRHRSRNPDPKLETAIEFTFYYPHSFPSPFAAYLIPADLQVGERVVLEDLIEDLVGSSWNQGDQFRLASCAAIWNGEDFEIQYKKLEFDAIIG